MANEFVVRKGLIVQGGRNQLSGSLDITGSLISPNTTGSLYGTASWAQNLAGSINSATFATQSIFATQSLNATYSIRSTMTTQSVWATQSSFATQSTYATQAIWSTQSLNATYSIRATMATQSIWATQSSFATQSLYTTQAIWATQSLNATYSIRATMATQSIWATQSSFSTTSLWSTNSISASLADNVFINSDSGNDNQYVALAPQDGTYPGYNSLLVGGIRYRTQTDTLTVTNVNGTASWATNSITTISASNVGVNTSGDTTYYNITFVSESSGFGSIKVDDGREFVYYPQPGLMVVPSITTSLVNGTSSWASYAVSASDAARADLLNVNNTSTDAYYYPAFFTSTSGDRAIYIDATGIRYNPGQNSLSGSELKVTASFLGNLEGTASWAQNLVGGLPSSTYATWSTYSTQSTYATYSTQVYVANAPVNGGYHVYFGALGEGYRDVLAEPNGKIIYDPNTNQLITNNLIGTASVALTSFNATQSIWASQSLNATYSIRSTMTTQSVWATQSLNATYSIRATMTTQSIWSTQSLWSTNSLVASRADRASSSYSSSYATASNTTYFINSSADAGSNFIAFATGGGSYPGYNDLRIDTKLYYFPDPGHLSANGFSGSFRGNLVANNIESIYITASNISSSLFGTASWAVNAVNAPPAVTATWATQSIYSTQSILALQSRIATQSIWASQSLWATNSLHNLSSSWASSSLKSNVGFAGPNGPYVVVVATSGLTGSSTDLKSNGVFQVDVSTNTLTTTASWASNALSANSVPGSGVVGVVSNATRATQSIWATQSLNATYSIRATMATQSIWATQSRFATQSIWATQSAFATESISASYALGGLAAPYGNLENRVTWNVGTLINVTSGSEFSYTASFLRAGGAAISKVSIIYENGSNGGTGGYYYGKFLFSTNTGTPGTIVEQTAHPGLRMITTLVDPGSYATDVVKPVGVRFSPSAAIYGFLFHETIKVSGSGQIP